MTARNFFVPENATIREALQVINSTDKLIALVVDRDERLIGTVTDGDIRRGLINGLNLDDKVAQVCKRTPVTASINDSREEILRKMRTYSVNQMLVVDEDGRVIRVDFADDQFLHSSTRNNIVVLMAGGLGMRLRPLTEDCPKPMLPLGGKPILRHIIDNFLNIGYHRFVISVNYRREVIKDYFGNGAWLGCDIQYLEEDQPLGTAGALSLLPSRPDKPFFVMNTDLLTTLNFVHLMDFHNEHTGAGTICVKEYCYEVPFGVIQTDNQRVTRLAEKPVHRFQINAGIYVLDPAALDMVPKNQLFHMTSLIQQLLNNDHPVFSFPVVEEWLDVGRPSDLEKAQCDYASERKTA
ncbi:MAG: nucleotidyltransferase family protein [Thermodesulfobacteriota bacterium]